MSRLFALLFVVAMFVGCEKPKEAPKADPAAPAADPATPAADPAAPAEPAK